MRTRSKLIFSCAFLFFCLTTNSYAAIFHQQEVVELDATAVGLDSFSAQFGGSVVGHDANKVFLFERSTGRVAASFSYQEQIPSGAEVVGRYLGFASQGQIVLCLNVGRSGQRRGFYTLLFSDKLVLKRKRFYLNHQVLALGDTQRAGLFALVQTSFRAMQVFRFEGNELWQDVGKQLKWSKGQAYSLQSTSSDLQLIWQIGTPVDFQPEASAVQSAQAPKKLSIISDQFLKAESFTGGFLVSEKAKEEFKLSKHQQPVFFLMSYQPASLLVRIPLAELGLSDRLLSSDGKDRFEILRRGGEKVSLIELQLNPKEMQWAPQTGVKDQIRPRPCDAFKEPMQIANTGELVVDAAMVGFQLYQFYSGTQPGKADCFPKETPRFGQPPERP
ncbi:MAG: hypothetical protein RRB13_03335 [bacterium]|nr:hypothetical protein [bacterium]